MKSSPFGTLHHRLTEKQRGTLLNLADSFFFLSVDRKGGLVTARCVVKGVAKEFVIDEDGKICQSSPWISEHESKLT